MNANQSTQCLETSLDFPPMLNAHAKVILKRTMNERSFKGQRMGGDKKKGRDQIGKDASRIHHVPDLTGHPEELTEVEKSGAPDFIIKTYLMVCNCDNELAEWSDGGDNFTVKNTAKFAQDEIPKYFEHSNFSSFTRQLHNYGFTKVSSHHPKTSSSHAKFSNEQFKRGRIGLLKNMTLSGKTGYTANNQAEEVTALNIKVTSHERQLYKMTCDIEHLKQLISSFICQQGVNTMLQNQDETQNGMQNTANMNVAAPVSDTYTSDYEPSAISPGDSEAEEELVHDQMTPILRKGAGRRTLENSWEPLPLQRMGSLKFQTEVSQGQDEMQFRMQNLSYVNPDSTSYEPSTAGVGRASSSDLFGSDLSLIGMYSDMYSEELERASHSAATGRSVGDITAQKMNSPTSQSESAVMVGMPGQFAEV